MQTRPPSPATFRAFAEMFPTEASWIAYLVCWRWPDGVSLRHLPRHLEAFVYRFNRRRVDPDIFGLLVRRMMQGEWTSKAALAGGR